MRRLQLDNPLVGFEALESLFEKPSNNTSYPPRNIIQIGENKFQITLAVAGFRKENLSVVREPELITIKGEPTVAEYDEEIKFIHRGLSNKRFETQFIVEEKIIVTGVRHNNGLLTIDLERIVPEEELPINLQID